MVSTRNQIANSDNDSFAKPVTITSLRDFQLLLDSIPVPFLQLDHKARIVGTNEKCAEMLNGSATRLRGKSFFRLLSRDDSKRLRASLLTAGRGSQPHTIRLSIRDGIDSHPVDMSLRRQLIGDGVTFSAVVEPVEDAHPAKDNTSQPDSGSITKLLLDLGGAAHLQSMGEIIGNYCRQEFDSPIGMMFVQQNEELQLISQWHSGRWPKKRMAEDMINKGPVARAFRKDKLVLWGPDRIRQSGGCGFLGRLVRWCNCRSIAFLPISAPKQSPIGLLAIMLRHSNKSRKGIYEELVRLGHTVSDSIVRGQAYDEAVNSRLKAETALRNKDEFLSVLSHELKNMMMPILGWAVALSSGTLAENKENLALEGIVRNVRALNYLIEDLFDAARIASGKLRLETSQIRIQDVAREALSAIQHIVVMKKLRISLDIAEGIPPFTADPRRLRQVLVNLLSNAAKFTPSGGSISMQVRQRGGMVECIVSDTGKGIEREFLPFVFDTFRQEKRSEHGHGAGLGLGLAIVQDIVKLHGGSIKAFSAGPDTGAVFTLRLPMHKKHSRTIRRSGGAPEPVLKKVYARTA
jgi:signal transduction histidine kinase